MTKERLEELRAIKTKNKKTKNRTKLSQVDKDQLLFALAELHGLIEPEPDEKSPKN